MAGKGGNKFGAFGGVFTPSILTILGVIMYLRLPWIVGQAGLFAAIGIVLVAHVVSVTTGLSISSIATDKKVGAGGPYYIISRSLGLPIGGTLGFALFIGLAFSISLYVIGFTESFLDTAGLEPTPFNIRVCGTITLVALTIITFISTSLALKSQYVILVLIVLSLVSIFLGTPAVVPAEPHLQAAEGAPALPVLFGVFFPAVTGFTAGVNMSGDLKDPKKAIPSGTLAAITVGLITYVGLAIFLSYRVGVDGLMNDPQILTRIAWVPFTEPGSVWSGTFVIAGIWGATLSSALGSILGAPRILQALSGDGVFLRFFAKGAGPTNEPRRALALAFIIAESGILIGELNLIANIVSMFFIAMYGFLNASCAIESWASTDFRPDFKIPKTVSVIGFVTCAVLMIQLDLASTMATVVLFAVVFSILKRRELTLESGDTWEGVWSSVVRAGLQRLTAGQRQTRNWRPNVLAFAPAGPPGERGALAKFGENLIRDRGVITRFSLVDKGAARRHHDDPAAHDQTEGVFTREVATSDRYSTIIAAMRFHGFSGMEPNAVLLDWTEHKADPPRFLEALDNATGLDFNVMLLHLTGREPYGARKRIDIWWERTHGSLPLSLRLIRFLTSTDEWRHAELRFLFIADDAARADTLIKTTERLLADARIQAEIKLIDNSLGARSYEEWVAKESQEADLTVLGLPRDSADCDERFLDATNELLSHLGATLLIRGSSGFRESFAGGALAASPATSHDALPVVPEEEVPPLELPQNPDVRVEVDRFARTLEGTMDGFWESCLGPVYGLVGALVERMDALVEKELGQLKKSVADTEGPRHKKAVVKARAALLFQARKILTDWESEELVALCDIVERRVELLREEMERVRDACPRTLDILRDPEELIASPHDDPAVRAAKRWLRWRSPFTKQARRYRVRTDTLYRWYLDYRAQRALWAALLDAATHSYRVVREIGRATETVRRELAALAAQSEAGLDEDTIEEREDAAGDQLHALLENTQKRAGAARWSLRAASREISRELSDDLLRFDVARVSKRERSKPPSSALEIAEKLPTIHEGLKSNLTLVVRRGELQVLNAAFQLRIGTIVQRAKEQLLLKLETGALRELEQLRNSLVDALERADDEEVTVPRVGVDLRTELDAQRLLEDLLKEVQAAAAELPESFDTAGDEALVQLNTEPFDEVEVLTLSLRRLAEFLVGGQFEEALEKELADAQRLERRAASVAHDVVRLVQFHLGERGAEEEVSDEDPAEERKRLLDNGVARLDSELEAMRALLPHLSDKLDDLLATIIDRTDAYAIAGNEETIRPYVSSDAQRRQALSLLGRAVESARDRAKDSMVTLMYRRSAGLLYARKLAGGEGNQENLLAERVRRVVDDMRPSPDVQRGLPFHYQQLFLRQARIGAEFWVGRQPELAEAARAVRTWKDGARGALMVVGERHAGKSSLCRQIGQRNFQRSDTFHLFPPPGGSIATAALRQRLRQELGVRGDLDEMMRGVPDGSVLVMHDVEMWWERADEGLPVIDTLQEIIDRHGDRLFFILNAGTHAFRFLDRVRGLSDQAFAVIECQPLDAEGLKEVISRRHRSTGLTFEIDGVAEEYMPAWQQARLFTRYFDHSGGRVGTALNQWIANIERIQGDILHMRAPRAPDVDVFREIKPSWIALLLELVLHRSVTRPRLERFCGLFTAPLGREIGALVRSGLVTETSDGVLEVNRFTHHQVVRHLRERGVL